MKLWLKTHRSSCGFITVQMPIRLPSGEPPIRDPGNDVRSSVVSVLHAMAEYYLGKSPLHRILQNIIPRSNGSNTTSASLLLDEASVRHLADAWLIGAPNVTRLTACQGVKPLNMG